MRLPFFNNVASVDDASTTYKTPKDVPDEKISILDVDGNDNLDLTGANATDRMIIVGGNNEGLAVQSPIIKKKDIIDVYTVDYRAPVKQVTTVGFNGTDGDIPAEADKNYRLKLINLLGVEETGSEPLPRVNVNYFTDSNDTPFSIARALAEIANRNNSFFAVAEALTDQASTQLAETSTGNNVTFGVTKGSKVIVATVTDGESIDGLSAGDYLRLGHATELDTPVYKVKSVASADGTEQEVTLERAWAGESATGVEAGQLDSDPDDSNQGGLKITADEVNVSFRTALNDAFGNTSPVISATPDVGSGTYKQAKEAEEHAQGAESFLYRETIYNGEKPRFFADSTLDYDVVVVRVDSNITPNIAKNTDLEITLFFKKGELSNAGADLSAFFGV